MTQLTTGVLELIGNSLWGFRPNLMKHIVEIHGSSKSILWITKNMPKYQAILKKWGPERTHLMAVAISSINGCKYSIYGHALSFQLHYFKNRKSLFPISEKEMMNFDANNTQQIIEVLSQAYDATGLAQEKMDLYRLMTLSTSPYISNNEDDNNINQLVEMFDFLNICGKEKRTMPDYAHDPINKNTALYNEYLNARS